MEEFKQLQLGERTEDDLYTSSYESLTMEELNRVSRLAFERGEDFKLREISQYAAQVATDYNQISFACNEDAKLLARSRIIGGRK